MAFSHILGNDSIKGYLTQMVQAGSEGNSLLFAGPEGIGKGLFAQALAQAVLCRDDPDGVHERKFASGNHPDLHLYRPEGKVGLHSIEALRRFSEEVYLYPYEAKKKVFILHDAERMGPASANALLKTFEEPSEDTLIILLSSHPEALLGTILSRCRKVYFRPVPEQELVTMLQKEGMEHEQASLFGRLAEGSVAKAKLWAQEGMDPRRERVLDFLEQGVLCSYQVLHQFSKELADEVEGYKKQRETEVRKQLLSRYPDPKGLTALQKGQVEKEVEGAVSLGVTEQVKGLLGFISSWYRDLSLIQSGASSARIFNLDREEALKTQSTQGSLPAAETLEKAVQDVLLAQARSSPLAPALESFFLKVQVAALQSS